MQRSLVRGVLLCACWLVGASPGSAQSPQSPFDVVLLKPAELPAWLRRGVKAQAPKYRMIGGRVFGSDSLLIAFEDSSLTSKGLEGNTWMFGPRPTKAESEQCPPEKVLGRKIARAVWREAGKPAHWEKVAIQVRGTRDMDRLTAITMFYYYTELAAPWVGDKN